MNAPVSRLLALFALLSASGAAQLRVTPGHQTASINECPIFAANVGVTTGLPFGCATVTASFTVTGVPAAGFQIGNIRYFGGPFANANGGPTASGRQIPWLTAQVTGKNTFSVSVRPDAIGYLSHGSYVAIIPVIPVGAGLAADTGTDQGQSVSFKLVVNSDNDQFFLRLDPEGDLISGTNGIPIEGPNVNRGLIVSYAGATSAGFQVDVTTNDGADWISVDKPAMGRTDGKITVRFDATKMPPGYDTYYAQMSIVENPAAQASLNSPPTEERLIALSGDPRKTTTFPAHNVVTIAVPAGTTYVVPYIEFGSVDTHSAWVSKLVLTNRTGTLQAVEVRYRAFDGSPEAVPFRVAGPPGVSIAPGTGFRINMTPGQTLTLQSQGGKLNNGFVELTKGDVFGYAVVQQILNDFRPGENLTREAVLLFRRCLPHSSVAFDMTAGQQEPAIIVLNPSTFDANGTVTIHYDNGTSLPPIAFKVPAGNLYQNLLTYPNGAFSSLFTGKVEGKRGSIDIDSTGAGVCAFLLQIAGSFSVVESQPR